MRNLEKIFWNHSENLSDKWENYIKIYNKHFEFFVKNNLPVSVLEIGVQNGGSLQIWKKFFPDNSTFTGLDIDPKCANLNLGNNIEVFCCNAADSNKLHSVLADRKFDIIIDDGSHRSPDILATFFSCLKLLNPGGIYVVEDLHCSYDQNFEGGFRKKGSALEFFKNLTDVLNYHHIPENEISTLPNSDRFHEYHKRIDSISFYDSVVVVELADKFEDHLYRRFLTGNNRPVYDNLKQLRYLANDSKHRLVVSHSLLPSVDEEFREKTNINPSLISVLRDENSYLYKYTNLRKLQNTASEVNVGEPTSQPENTDKQRNISKLKRFKKKWKRSLTKRLNSIGIGQKHPQTKGNPAIKLPIPQNYMRAVQEFLLHSDYSSKYEFVEDGSLKFTILITIFNTPPHLLERLLKTVLLQSYKNFEVVIVNDCSIEPHVHEILSRFSVLDKRIKLVQNGENLGISGAHNAGLKISTGDYIALVDHDDELAWNALECVAACILQHPDADLVYSDECILNEDGYPIQILAKPDWSPVYLTNCMYLGHLSVYRRSIIQKIGGFQSAFDFSQDYDLALRVTETTDKIYHIAQPLYGWRAIASSAAGGGKDFARTTNIAALQAAADRREWQGVATPLSHANRIVWKQKDVWPKVTIIVPSDNVENIKLSIESIENRSTYPNYEVVIVTNSNIIKLLKKERLEVKFVAYDKPFNFSDKCNKGAEIASGQFLVFFNDDVRIIDQDWLEQLVNIGLIEGVGAVAPKMLYEDQTIQHAGMVTGVRRLVGTAFHGLNDTQDTYFNMPSQLREVSLLCGACLLVSRETFTKIGGFDAINTPIAHSDIDLCFKIRALQQTCIYQPDVKLMHLGHQSIAEIEKDKIAKIDKSDIYLLKRWPAEIADDPYFTPLMKALLYHDSPEDFIIYPGNEYTGKAKGDVLLVSHDLTNSGAPRVVVEMAKALSKEGYFVVIASCEDGPLRHELQSLGFNVIVDSLLFTMHESVLSFARNFDIVIANTVVSWPIVKQLDQTVPVLWYIHEVELISELAESFADCALILRDAKNIVAVSEYALKHIQKYRTFNTPLLETGFPQLCRKENKESKLKISVFGSFEYRKGQDILLKAMDHISADSLNQFTLQFFGRNHDKDFKNNLSIAASRYQNVNVNGELTHDECMLETELSDLIIVPSRSDTLPIVSIDALGAGVPVMCTVETGTSRYIENNKSGFIIYELKPEIMANALEEALKRVDEWRVVGNEGRLVFEKHFSSQIFEQNLFRLVDDVMLCERKK
ncbi:glycosyltransferase [Bartonella sp. LJL80]